MREAEGDDPLVGSSLDERYRVEQKLGEGGMGNVYQVTHLALGRTMAAKVLRPELAETDLSVRFMQEVRASAAVEHPNVVHITDFGTLESGQPFFVMELLVGRSLRALLEQGPLPPSRVAMIARQVAEGLYAAHRAGIVHRDLKPDNVHVDEGAGDVVKVFDFGLARIIGTARLTKRGVVFGTPQYMSPEQAAGEPSDPATDIYALGVMMYEMLAGRVPFEAPTFQGVFQQHLYGTPSPIGPRGEEQPPGDVEAIALRCLAKRPENRFASMKEVVAALDLCAMPEPPVSSEDDFAAAPTSPAWEGPRRARERLKSVLVALLVTALGAGSASWYCGRSRIFHTEKERASDRVEAREQANDRKGSADPERGGIAQDMAAGERGRESPSVEETPPSRPTGPRSAFRRSHRSSASDLPGSRGESKPLPRPRPEVEDRPPAYVEEIIDPWADPLP